MKMIPKRLAMALLMVASAVFSFNSHAATIDLGTLAVGDTKFGAGFGFGSVSDTWKFEVTQTGKLSGFFAGLAGTISSLSPSSIGSGSFSSGSLPYPLSTFLSPVLLAPSVVLTPGMYSITVTGTTTPFLGGFGAYVGTVGLTAVPLPAPVMLLGSAMLTLVGFARRRSA